MALTKFTASTAIIAALASLPNATDGLTAAQFKAKFDENPEAFKVFVNSLIDQLEATTTDASGAHRIGSAPIAGVAGATPYAQMTDLKAQINNATTGTLPDGSVALIKLTPSVRAGIRAGKLASYKSQGGL